MDIVGLLGKLVWAIIVGVVVGLIVWVVGSLLVMTGIPVVVSIGGFLVAGAWLLGLLAGLGEVLSGTGRNWWSSRRV